MSSKPKKTMHQVFKVTRGDQQYMVIVEGTPKTGLKKVKDIEPEWANIEHIESCDGEMNAYLKAQETVGKDMTHTHLQ